jgi:GNAT superfamily N-acetyltransferase
MSVTILHVTTSKQIKTFIDFPHELYKDDPNYVPELFIAVKELLSPKKNPYFKHSEASSYLAYENGKVVGRITATVNNNYNKFHHSNVGFFGFFDCINDNDVANALFDVAEEYCKKVGVTRILGPTNLSTNDTAGLLVEGFDSPPVVQMTYNKPYYSDLISSRGFVKEMDLYAYKISTSNVNKKALRLTDRFKERLNQSGITFRNLNMKNFQQEVDNIREIYISAWEVNWGFVPPTNEEFDFLAEGLKMIINPEYAYVAEHDGKAVGFALGLPNINEILINIKKGRLFPTGLFKLLFGKKKTKAIRIVLLGVKEEYRKKGIEGILFANFIKGAMTNNLDFGEASWVLENNEMMVKAAENLNGDKYKTYRIYSKDLNS